MKAEPTVDAASHAVLVSTASGQNIGVISTCGLQPLKISYDTHAIIYELIKRPPHRRSAVSPGVLECFSLECSIFPVIKLTDRHLRCISMDKEHPIFYISKYLTNKTVKILQCVQQTEFVLGGTIILCNFLWLIMPT